jgi:hypothetical protein
MTIAFVIGNGVSRQAVNLELLCSLGKIYGCNALYRDFTPDVLVATDKPIATEIQNSGYPIKNKFYTHKNLIPPELEWADKGPTIVDEYGKLKSGNQIILRSHNEYIAHRYNLNALYGGINQNPDISIQGSLSDRDQENITIPPFFMHKGIAICHPFVYTKKDWIIKQYYENSIEDLLALTRSCEGEFEGLDYTTYNPGQYVPVCGECFWCKERKWAINESK